QNTREARCMFLFGDNYFGKTDHVPGLFLVRTRFLHIWFFPLVPRESYLFFDEQPADHHWGVRIPFHWKSVLLCWMRSLVVVLAGILLSLSLVMLFEAEKMKLSDKLKLGTFLLGLTGFFSWAYWLTLRITTAVPERAFALAEMLQIPKRIVEEYLKGNRTVFWKSLDLETPINQEAIELAPSEHEAIVCALKKTQAEGSFVTNPNRKN